MWYDELHLVARHTVAVISMTTNVIKTIPSRISSSGISSSSRPASWTANLSAFSVTARGVSGVLTLPPVRLPPDITHLKQSSSAARAKEGGDECGRLRVGVAARAPASVRCQLGRLPPFPGLSFTRVHFPLRRRRPESVAALLLLA